MAKRLNRWMLGIAMAMAPVAQAGAEQSASVTVHADQAGPQINRQVFGQFAEHLGHGIYEGIWVGPKSRIPKINA